MDPRIQRLISHFGTQQKAALALGVDQTTISGWLRGKHSISPANALRVQVATRGAIDLLTEEVWQHGVSHLTLAATKFLGALYNPRGGEPGKPQEPKESAP